MKTTEIVYGRTGQVVEFYPPECVRECLGIPSSVTASVYFGTDSNDDAVEFSPVVTVDSTSQTVTTASGQAQTNRNRVIIGDTTGITPGTLYLLDNACKQREAVEPKKIVDFQTVDMVHDLQYDYAITVSLMKGIKCSFTVDATWVVTEANILAATEPSYRIVWTYTVAGTVYSAQTYLRLVRKPFKSTITYEDMVDRWPDLLDSQPRHSRGDKFAEMIAGAEKLVRTDIISEGYKPEQINDTEILDRLVSLALDCQLARFYATPMGRDREQFIAESKAEYGQFLAKTITTLKVDIDTGTEGASTFEPVSSYFFRR